MKIQETNEDGAGALALGAVGWTLAEPARAERLLALTGLTPEDLRGGLGEPAMLAAILRYLEAHEPDLLACAEALDTSPAALVEARRILER
ncbi:DUF3572 family protein [Allosphingosinicella sp.]|jgi:hypothetical protein|uniref:DUF3572 family protein n=1 Tax=Allosphingosinicella sp. TaxID=2823234 RepID=UPI002F1CEC68